MNFIVVMRTWTLALLLVCAAAPLTGGAAEMNSSTLEKRLKYSQMKLPELVRRANGNDAAAQFELGSRFNYGRQAPKNNVEAMRWLRRSAQNGHREAQRLLAVKLYNGYDIAVDHDEAMLWAMRLAEVGDVPAQLMIGNMYANGEGGPRDLVQAYAWYDIASTLAQQEGADPLQLQAALDSRDRMGALLLPAEEAKAQEQASAWWLRKQGVSLVPKAKAKPKAGKAPAAKKTDVETRPVVTSPEAKPKAPEQPKLPGAPEAPIVPPVKKP